MKTLIKIISLVLIATLFVPTFVAGISASGTDQGAGAGFSFKDVTKGRWYYPYVWWAYAKTIVNGKTPEKFAPEDPITRGEFVALLWRYSGSANPKGGSYFEDGGDSAGKWYTPAVNWAFENGIIDGETIYSAMGEALTRMAYPERDITRAQIIKILFDYMKIERGVYTDDSVLTKFDDYDFESPAWKFYIEPLIWAAKNSVISGYEFNIGGKIRYLFKADRGITRAETCKVLYYVLDGVTPLVDNTPDKPGSGGDVTYTEKKNHLGCDLSRFQGNINSSKFKSSGISFAYLRMWYDSKGVTVNGVPNVDANFDYYYRYCKENGILTGAYWFLYSYSVDDAVSDAKACIEVLKKYKMDLPVALDVEEDSVNYIKRRGITPVKDLVSTITEAWLNTLKAAGYDVILYTNEHTSQTMDGTGYLRESTLEKYKIWLAKWYGSGTLSDTTVRKISSGEIGIPQGNSFLFKNAVMWQFGMGSGSSFGVESAELDLDMIYGFPW